jgi:hypothetical protein
VIVGGDAPGEGATTPGAPGPLESRRGRRVAACRPVNTG